MSKLKIVNQRASSDKYGKCELCGKHVSEVHTLYYGNYSFWGHYECVGNLLHPDLTEEQVEILYYKKLSARFT